MSVVRSAAPWLGLLVACALATTDARAVTTLPLDGARSTAEFEVHLRLPMRGVGHFGQIAGELIGAPLHGWQVAVRIDGRSLRFDGPAWMGTITRSRAFLDVQDFPGVTLRTDTIPDALLHRGGKIRGELTLRGVTRTATFDLLPPTCSRPGQDCDLRVQGTVSRRDFGMSGYRFTLRDGVDVRVRLRWQGTAAP